MNNQKQIHFTAELWKLILEVEELVRNHYLRLVEQEFDDLDDQKPPEPF